MPPNARIRPTNGGADLKDAGGRSTNNVTRCVKCRPWPAVADATGLCPWHRAKDPDLYLDWLMRLAPNDTARGGGWQFQHPDGSWRVEAMAEAA